MKLGTLQIGVIVIGTLAMFAAVFMYSSTVHSPMVRSLCDSSCASIHSDAAILKLKSSSVGTRTGDVADCICQRATDPSSPESGQTFEGYFLTSIAPLDWFAMVLLLLIPLAVIMGFGVFAIAKIIQRL